MAKKTPVASNELIEMVSKAGMPTTPAVEVANALLNMEADNHQKQPQHSVLLIDQIIAQGRSLDGGPMPKSVFNTLKQGRLTSERFIFSPEASRMVGSFAMNDADLVLRNRQFAIPPFKNTYIEIDSRQFFKDAKEDITPEHEKDDRLGYLSLGPYVYVLFNRYQDGNKSGVAFWRYKVVPPGNFVGKGDVDFDIRDYVDNFREWLKNQPAMSESLLERFDNSPEEAYKEAFRLNILLGGGTPINSTKMYKDSLDILNEVKMEWLVPETHPLRANKILTAQHMRGFFGDIRNWWALQLWLNQQQRIRLIGTPAGRKIVRGKVLPYLRYNTVHINLGRCKTIRRAYMLANERQSPGAHKVREHWAHRGGHRACIHEEGHDWPMVADASGHFVCKHCKLRRWRVTEHQRGDAGLGFIQKHYEVEADNE